MKIFEKRLRKIREMFVKNMKILKFERNLNKILQKYSKIEKKSELFYKAWKENGNF